MTQETRLPRAGERGLKYPSRAQTGQTGPKDWSDRSELQNPVSTAHSSVSLAGEMEEDGSLMTGLLGQPGRSQ